MHALFMYSHITKYFSIFTLLILSSTVYANDAENALLINNKDSFISIQIGFGSWEGDTEGISLNAQGRLQTWNKARSDTIGRYPEGEMSWDLPIEKVHDFVKLLAKPGVLVPPGKKQKGLFSSEDLTSTRMVTTTKGKYELSSSRHSDQAEKYLNRLRFYLAQKGVVNSIQVKAPTKKLKSKFLRLSFDRVLTIEDSPANRKKTSHKHGWLIGESNLFRLMSLLEKAQTTKVKAPSNIQLSTDQGEFFLEEDKQIIELLHKIYFDQIGLKLNKKQRFQRLHLSVSHQQKKTYSIEIQADGKLITRLGSCATPCPLKLDQSSAEIQLSNQAVYELVRLIKKTGIKKQSVKQTTPKIEIQLFIAEREDDPEIFENHIIAYEYSESQIISLSDNQKAITKYLTNLANKNLVRRGPGGSNDK
jgi:hypothetical protein